MCGISGFFNPNQKKIDFSILQNFVEVQNHRGPDNAGFYYDDFIGLGHNRLSIIDLSENGNQPFEKDPYYLVYNGEIYNYLDVKEYLDASFKIEYRSTSDSEVLFYALIHLGVEKTLELIKGMFAFAFYDKQKEELILGRDRLGIKPLFYFLKDNSLYFASEMKAITNTFPPKVDKIKALYATLGVLEKSRYETAFENLFHVTPGTYVRYSNKGLEKHTYFTLKDMIEEEEYRRYEKASSNEVLSEFEHLFATAVEKMLMSDAPIGAFVSGGIDSSLIALYSNKHVKDFKFFTANVVGRHSEYKEAKLLADTLERELFDYKFQPDYLLRDLVKTTWHYESPIVVHANAMAFGNVASITREQNVKAVLTGEGSDEMFLGYPRLLTRRFDHLIKAPYQVIDFLFSKIPPLKRYVSGGRSAGIESLFELASQNFTRQILREEGLKKYEFLPEKDRREHYLTVRQLNEGIVSLLWRNDRMGMIYSIESRFPFLDETLLKFSVNLPMKYKIGRIGRFYNYKHPFLIDKYIVRKLAEKSLPKKLVYKKKQGFPVYGLQHVDLQESFFKDGFVKWLFDFNDVQIKYFLNNFPKYHLAKFAALEIWGNLFVNGNSIENVQEKLMKNASMNV